MTAFVALFATFGVLAGLPLLWPLLLGWAVLAAMRLTERPDAAATALLLVALLTGASLTRASLTRASLTRASLTRASLTRASLTRAFPRGTFLGGALLAGTRAAGPRPSRRRLGWIAREQARGRAYAIAGATAGVVLAVILSRGGGVALPAGAMALLVAAIGRDRRAGLLLLGFTVAAAGTGWAGPAAGLLALFAARLPGMPPTPLAGALIAALGLATASPAAILVGAALLGGVWPCGGWVAGVPVWIAAAAEAAALAGAAAVVARWPATGPAVAAAGAVTLLLGPRPSAVAGLAACAVGLDATPAAVLLLAVDLPLRLLDPTGPGWSGRMRHWTRAMLPPGGPFWVAVAVAVAAGHAQPWLLLALLPGLLRQATRPPYARSADPAQPAGPAWITWLALVPAALAMVPWPPLTDWTAGVARWLGP